MQEAFVLVFHERQFQVIQHVLNYFELGEELWIIFLKIMIHSTV